MNKKIGIAIGIVILIGIPLWYFKAPLNLQIGVPKDEQVNSVDGEVKSIVHTDDVFCDKFSHEKGQPFLRHVVNKFADGKWAPEGTSDDKLAVDSASLLIQKKDFSFFQVVMGENKMNSGSGKVSEHYCFDPKGELVAYSYQHNEPVKDKSFMYVESFRDGKLVKGEFKGVQEIVAAKEKTKEKPQPKFRNKKDLFKLVGYEEQKK